MTTTADYVNRLNIDNYLIRNKNLLRHFSRTNIDIWHNDY